MKILWLLAVIVLSEDVLAYPEIGDSARFQKSDGSVYEIINKGLDLAHEAWIVEINDTSGMQIEKWPVSDMPSKNEVLSVLKNCIQYSGAKEKIVVPAGVFETCKFANEVGGFTWIGDVPFSMVKVVTSDFTLELLSFGPLNISAD